jgi:hypothetical protein
MWLHCHKLKKNPCLIPNAHVNKVSKTFELLLKKLQLMSYNMMIGYDIYDCFTMEGFPLRQSMFLTTSFFVGDSNKMVVYKRNN